MFVRTLRDLEALARIRFPAGKSFRSARYITASDGLGFSYNENTVGKGTDLTVWLKHHWEANYIISGRGEVTDLTSNESWPLRAGVLYVVGPNDRHRLHLTEDERHISIFYPPLTGNERFDADGSYEASGPIEKTDRRMFVRQLDEMRAAGLEEISTNGQVRSLSMLTESDAIGFGLSDKRLAPGAEMVRDTGECWQANHILAGEGSVTNIASGRTWELGSGTAYNVAPEDRYRLHATSELHWLSMSSLPCIDSDDSGGK